MNKKLFQISIIKTILFNLYYFGRRGVKLPVILSRKVKINSIGGSVKLLNPHFGCVKIGFESTSAFDYSNERSIWDNNGTIVFEGDATLGQGTRISNHGEIIFGDGFRSIANCNIICYKYISYGKDCLVSWGVQFLDTDFHKIFKNGDERSNFDKEIVVGNHIWVCSRCSILKGAEIADDVIVAANSIVSNKCSTKNALIGNYGKIIKEEVNWEP